MLTLSVAATLIGFGLLVFALITSNFALAVACIVVCVIGLVLLLVDTLRANKRGRGGVEDEPLFTIRGRESAVRSEPLLDEDDDASRGGAAAGVVGAGALAGGVTAGVASDDGDDDRSDDERTFGKPDLGKIRGAVPGLGQTGEQPAVDQNEVDQNAGEDTRAFDTRALDEQGPTSGATDDSVWRSEAASGGLGSIVSPDAHGSPVGDVEDLDAQNSGAAAAEQGGDMNDYIRSVTGSFPAQSGSAPIDTGQAQSEFTQAEYTEAEYTQAEFTQPEYTQADLGERPEFTKPDTQEWQRGDLPADTAGVTGGQPGQDQTYSDQWSAPRAETSDRVDAPQTQQPELSDPAESGHWPAAASPYVGRRRRADESDSVVVNSPDPTLPAMKLVYGDDEGENPGRRHLAQDPLTGDDRPADGGSGDGDQNR